MKESAAMAYANMYGVLGTLENLCAMDVKAQSVLTGLKHPVSLCLSVKNGPCCTFHFSKGSGLQPQLYRFLLDERRALCGLHRHH